MKASITQTRTPDHTSSKNTVFVESPFDSIADKWFDANKVMNLTFKCKTWDRVKRLASRANVKALQDLFPDATSIKYSRKAGCRCGCSPGYLVKLPNVFLGKNYWVSIQATSDEIAVVERHINNEKHRKDLLREVMTSAAPSNN